MPNSYITYIAPKEKFVMVSNSIVEKYDADVVGVYCKLVKLSSGKSLNIDFISKKIKINARKIRKIVVFLENEGYIVREPLRNKNGYMNGWNYLLYAEPVSESERSHAGKKKEKEEKEKSVLPKIRQDGKSDKSEKGQDNILSNTKVLSNTDKNFDNINKNRLSNDNQKVEYSDEFLAFWSLYHNGSKQQAYKEWNKLKLKEQQNAIDCVNTYLNYCKYSGRKQKDTSSYLHQKGFNEDWLATPDCYIVQETDNERIAKFKRWMALHHQELIFHRNPLTFEQANECIEKFTFSQTEWAMNKLKQRDIHQYFSIAKGIEAIVSDNSDFEDLEEL